jgi:cytochrome c oxidase assembly protein subunit 15
MVDGGGILAARRRRILATWLLLVLVMVCAIVLIGGLTRLTHSGLSMVNWKPITGWLPPIGEAAWEEAFHDYRQFPEYKELNVGMTLAEFKAIFLMEFSHRLWGRLIGVAFVVPFAYFVIRGWLDRRLTVKFAVALVLGGAQGVLGWYMVKSGLVDQPDVSQYRLAAHLALALVISAYLLWLALEQLFPGSADAAAGRALNTPARVAAGLVFAAAVSGAFVAGLDAGFAYNTFPLMEGSLIPEGLFDMDPLYLNVFENITTVQFDHRLMATAVLAAAIWCWWRARNAGLPRRTRRAVSLLMLLAILQVVLGISTLLLVVPVPMALTHQACAMALFAVSIWIVHETRTQRLELRSFGTAGGPKKDSAGPKIR